MATMELYRFVLILSLLPAVVLAQPEAAQLEERLAAAIDSERINPLVDLAELYRKTEPGRAVELGNEALGLLERFPDNALELRNQNSLAHALGSLSQYRQALGHARRAEELARDQEDSSALAFAMGRAAYAYRKLGDNTEALTHYNAALRIHEELGERVDVAFCLSGRCRVRWRTGQFETALKDCLDAYEILQELGNVDEQTTALNHLGLVYDQLGQSEEALRYYNRALELQQGGGDQDGGNQDGGNRVLISRLLNNIGVIYHNRGDLDRSLEYYSRSLRIKEELGDLAGVSRRLTSIGNIYRELVFSVRDNGIGVDTPYHEKVFDLFERLDPEVTEGTGIGLALAKQTVESHGGRIWVESQGLGLGSTFKLVLPWVSATEN